MPDQHYVIKPPADSYVVKECDDDDSVQVEHTESEDVQLREVVVLTLDGEPGPPGADGEPGPPGADGQPGPTGGTYHWDSPGAVTVVDFDHPLPFTPNVQLIDSGGTVWVISPVLTPGHVHIDLGGLLMSVSVDLS